MKGSFNPDNLVPRIPIETTSGHHSSTQHTREAAGALLMWGMHTIALTEHPLQPHEAADEAVKIQVHVHISVAHGDEIVQLAVQTEACRTRKKFCCTTLTLINSPHHFTKPSAYKPIPSVTLSSHLVQVTSAAICVARKFQPATFCQVTIVISIWYSSLCMKLSCSLWNVAFTWETGTLCSLECFWWPFPELLDFTTTSLSWEVSRRWNTY